MRGGGATDSEDEYGCHSAFEQIIPTAGESERGPGEKSERPKSGFETVAYDSAGGCQEQRAAEDDVGGDRFQLK